MAFLVGVDEAGYGPLLGPLCVGAAVLEVAPAHFAPSVPIPPPSSPDSALSPVPTPDLWQVLGTAVCRKPRDTRGRIAIDDSKKLKRPNDSAAHPLEHLERGVLAWVRCLAPSPAMPIDALDDLALLRLLGAAPSATAPWSGDGVPLPLANDRGLLGIAAQRLHRALDANGLAFRALRVRALDAPEFNAAFERTRSKASVNSMLALEHLLEVCRSHRDDEIIAAFDRHGGRTHYRDDLALTFPDAIVRVIEESESASRYELHDARRVVRISWQSEAESRHLPVALASMAAKFVRELWMARLNRYFTHFLPEVKATAGYVEDGRRWLRQVEPHLAGLGLDPRQLVRRA